MSGVLQVGHTPDHMSAYHDTLIQAMHVYGNDQAAADALFEELVQSCMRRAGVARDEAERIQRSNLGYYAGYFDNDTRARVERLFKCEHPYFGAIAVNGPPTAQQAYDMGVKQGQAWRRASEEKGDV